MNTSHQNLRERLQRDLEKRHGLLMGGKHLRAALGFETSAAFRQAVLRRLLTVPVFAIPNRKGHFALTEEVAEWLAACRHTASEPASIPRAVQRSRVTPGKEQVESATRSSGASASSKEKLPM